MRLIYGNRVVDQIANRDELGSQEVVYVLSDPPENWRGESGYIDAALMDRVFSAKEFSDWAFVMCGPAIMMDIVEDHLIEKGTPSHRILSERFDYD